MNIHDDFHPDAFRYYQCHKVVRAAQIESIAAPRGECRAFLLVECDEPLFVPTACTRFAAAREGGYVVAYSDGYVSYSPKDVFEAGYDVIDAPDAIDTATPAKEFDAKPAVKTPAKKTPPQIAEDDTAAEEGESL